MSSRVPIQRFLTFWNLMTSRSTHSAKAERFSPLTFVTARTVTSAPTSLTSTAATATGAPLVSIWATGMNKTFILNTSVEFKATILV